MKQTGWHPQKRRCVIEWLPEDIKSLKSEWPIEKCQEWLDEHRDKIIDRSIEAGWFVIQTMLDDSKEESK